MLVAVVADTHLPRGRRHLPERCVDLMRGADALIHAGDFITTGAHEEIGALGPPLHAVHGNVDEPALRAALPPALEVELDGVRVAVVHDAGPAPGRGRRMRERFPAADVVVFGHTHVPLIERHGGLRLLNPGSPTERRRAPTRSMGLIRTGARGARLEIVPLA